MDQVNNHADQSQLTGTTNWYTGDMAYRDIDGDKVITRGSRTLNDHGDLVRLGNDTPRYMFGITVGAEWKGIDFEMFWQGVGKRDIWGGSIPEFWPFYNQWMSPITYTLDRWMPTDFEKEIGVGENKTLNPAWLESANPGAYYPRIYMGNNGKNQWTSRRYMQSGAYGRLKNLMIGYTIPKSITEKAGISKLRIYLQGENLLTISPMKKYADPETINKMTYPIQKKYSIGVNLTF